MRKRTTQLSVLLAALAFSSMASSVFSGEPLRGSFTVIITTHLAMIARSNESYFLSRPIYRRSNNGIAGDGDAVDHNSTRSNRGGIAGDGGAVDHNSSRSNHGIVGEGGGATEQIGSVGSFYQGARGGEGSGGHGDITGAIRVAQHHDWIVQQINDGGDDVVNILTTKIPNSTGQQINCVELIFTKDEGAGQQIIEFDDVISFSDFDQGLDLQDINHDGRIRVSEIITADLGFGYDTFGIRKAIMDNDAGSAGGNGHELAYIFQQKGGAQIVSLGGDNDNNNWHHVATVRKGIDDPDDDFYYELSAGGNGTHDTALAIIRKIGGLADGGSLLLAYEWRVPTGDNGTEIGEWEIFGQRLVSQDGFGLEGELNFLRLIDNHYAPRFIKFDEIAWRGDANRDGMVTGTDLIVVQQNFGLSVALDGPLDGDANDDGQVTGMDLIEVQQTFGQVTGNAIVGSGLSNGVIVDDNHFIGPLGGDGVFSVHNNTFEQVESTDAAVVAAVPEPATIALMSAGLLFMRKIRRTR